jgi:hypothetical protein
MNRHFPGKLTRCLLPLMLAAGGSALRADVLTGPFQPGTGSWDTMPAGSFESGPGPLRSSTSYSLAGDMFLLRSIGSSGTASTEYAAAQAGSLGAVIHPGTFSGSGIALSYDGAFSVGAGTQYVLSAFIRRPSPGGSLAHIYIDNGDNAGDYSVNTSAATDGWQFVWGVYTAPQHTGVTPRVVVDFQVSPTDVVYVDEFAFTPLADFQPPVQAVPEPAVTWSLLGMTLPALLARKWIRRAQRG